MNATPLSAAAPLQVPLSDSYRLDPSSTWVWLRDYAPITRARTVAGHEVWLVTRYAEVRTVLSDPRFSRAAAVRSGGPHAAVVAPRPGTLTALDPPDHTRMRRLVAGAFAPRRIEQWRPWIASLARKLTVAMADGEAPADLRAALALPLPLAVIGTLLGIPETDWKHFENWSDQLYSLATPAPSDGDTTGAVTVAAGAYDALHGYFAELLARKRAAGSAARPAAAPISGLPPGPDLLDELAVGADSPSGLSSTELAGFAGSLLVAGYETTASQLGAFAVELLREPTRWHRLIREPALIPAAVEELLRINRLSETGQVRVALVDTQLAGVTVQAGEGVLAVIGPANRDARAFSDPDRYDPDRYGPDRDRCEQHLTFGYGPHFCLGAQLARIELVEALRALLDVLPGLGLAVPAEEIVWRRTLIRGPERVPVIWAER
ncbi:MAG: cytochrome P450 [Pseudonocardiaceae bacterium]